jgi:predicted AlkP superfamily pyrophosphatase or phosphodiesterase
MSLDHVKNVFSKEDIISTNGNDYFVKSISNGFDPKQSGDLVVLDKPGYVEYGTTGTEHGSPYSYDTHVPLIFYGWHIKHGESFAKKEITQIAPTIAQKIKVAFPNGTEANVLLEVLDSK